MTEVDIILKRKNFNVAIHEKISDGITGIFGPSGSGKTSLLHSISGLAIPQSGRILVNGKVVFDSRGKVNVPVEKRRIGYVFQEGRLFPHMTVEKNLLYGYKKDQKNKVNFDEVVELLNLKHLLTSKPTSISGGERQRTALGRSLLSSPEILLLDEPFSAVDMQHRNQILPFILRIQHKVSIPILVVSHDLPDLLKLTNTLFIISEGKCIGHGEYYTLLKNATLNNLLGTNVLVNSITMSVLKIEAERGLTILEWRDKKQEVKIKCEKSKYNYNVGEEIKIFINADDIALADEKISNVTIQNQIEGTVTDVIERSESLLCIIDAGFRLVVEITSESKKRLAIEKGNKIWCLFKSVAIDVVG